MSATYIYIVHAMLWPIIWQVASIIMHRSMSAHSVDSDAPIEVQYISTQVYTAMQPIEVCQHTQSGPYSDNVMIIHLSDSLL